jgi:hypothetical protein
MTTSSRLYLASNFSDAYESDAILKTNLLPFHTINFFEILIKRKKLGKKTKKWGQVHENKPGVTEPRDSDVSDPMRFGHVMVKAASILPHLVYQQLHNIC